MMFYFYLILGGSPKQSVLGDPEAALGDLCTVVLFMSFSAGSQLDYPGGPQGLPGLYQDPGLYLGMLGGLQHDTQDAVCCWYSEPGGCLASLPNPSVSWMPK